MSLVYVDRAARGGRVVGAVAIFPALLGGYVNGEEENHEAQLRFEENFNLVLL